MRIIQYSLIPFGMCILSIEGLLGFFIWIFVDVPKKSVSFLVDSF